VTQYLPTEDRVSYYGRDIKAMLAVALGGRAAERLVFDDLSAGVADDLKRATRLARVMVTQCGMSERVGPVFFRDSDENPFLGREMSEMRDHSEHTAQLIDEEVGRILREADDRAYHILEEHREDLERVTEALIEREVLSVAEIEEMIGKRVTDPEAEESPARPQEIVASLDNPSS
jgi:cell division protease FtsH